MGLWENKSSVREEQAHVAVFIGFVLAECDILCAIIYSCPLYKAYDIQHIYTYTYAYTQLIWCIQAQYSLHSSMYQAQPTLSYFLYVCMF